MRSKNLEVEIKFPLLNATAVAKRLNKLAKKAKSEYQKDIYYIPTHRNFLEQNPVFEWLRLRETKNGANVNYKHWHSDKDKRAISADEYETEIGDIEVLQKVLEALDFKEIVIVEKQRSTWIYKGVEIAIDKVTNLGEFIELEAKGNFLALMRPRIIYIKFYLS